MRFLLSLILAILFVPALTEAKGDDFDGTLRIGGSSTLLPIIADCANAFMEKHETWDKVDPSLPKKQILVFVTGGGSGFGVKAAMSGAVQIGLSSRPLKDEEKLKLGEHKTFLVSKDCLAIATNRRSPLAGAKENLTKAEVAKILSGEAKTWREVDPSLPAEPIVVVMRDASGGSTEILQKEVLKERTFSPGALQVPSQGANLKKLEDNSSSFGYLSSVLALGSDKLKVFTYEGVAPSNENVLNGTYALTRPLLLIVKGAPTAAQKAFIDFILGEGQKIVEAHGYVPVAAAAK